MDMKKHGAKLHRACITNFLHHKTAHLNDGGFMIYLTSSVPPQFVDDQHQTVLFFPDNPLQMKIPVFPEEHIRPILQLRCVYSVRFSSYHLNIS